MGAEWTSSLDSGLWLNIWTLQKYLTTSTEHTTLELLTKQEAINIQARLSILFVNIQSIVSHCVSGSFESCLKYLLWKFLLLFIKKNILHFNFIHKWFSFSCFCIPIRPMSLSKLNFAYAKFSKSSLHFIQSWGFKL